MTTEFDRKPDRIRAQVEALLAELPAEDDQLAGAQTDLDESARRLEEAHDVLLRALESVERG